MSDKKAKILLKSKNIDESKKEYYFPGDMGRTVQANYGLVKSIVNSSFFVMNCFDYDDLISSGNLGLIRAYQRYDSNRGVSFGHYAKFWIRCEIFDFLEKKGEIKLNENSKKLRNFLVKTVGKVFDENGYLPNSQELYSYVVKEFGVVYSEFEISDMLNLGVSSLDSYVGEEGNSTLGDFVADEKVDILGSLEQRLLGIMLRDNIVKLGEEESKYFVEHVVEGREIREIANRYDKQVDRIHSSIRKSRAKLKNLISSDSRFERNLLD